MRIQLSGELNIYGASQLKTSLLEALQRYPELHVDLADVQSMDGATLQVLALLHREAARLAKNLHLSGSGAVLMHTIRTIGMQHYFGESLASGQSDGAVPA
jgi:anti-anti-sigma factor